MVCRVSLYIYSIATLPFFLCRANINGKRGAGGEGGPGAQALRRTCALRPYRIPYSARFYRPV